MKRTSLNWCVLLLGAVLACPAMADDSLKTIPRIDVHAHVGAPERMAEYVEISDSLRQKHDEHLAAWIDLSFRRDKESDDDAYLESAFVQHKHRFLPCLWDVIEDGLDYTPNDLVAWQKRGVVGLKIWVGVSDAIDRPEHDPLFAKMTAIGMPGASIHISQPYPTTWCDDPVAFWQAQNAWERVLDRHPDLVAVNAHMLDHFNSDEQLDYLAYMLETYSNLHVDLAARFQQFHRMDRDKLRAFLIRFQDRILFGTDIGRVYGGAESFAERYHRCFQLLESDETVQGCFFNTEQEYRGLALPRDVLKKIYWRNAVKIYPALKKSLTALGYAVEAEASSSTAAR